MTSHHTIWSLLSIRFNALLSHVSFFSTLITCIFLSLIVWTFSWHMSWIATFKASSFWTITIITIILSLFSWVSWCIFISPSLIISLPGCCFFINLTSTPTITLLLFPNINILLSCCYRLSPWFSLLSCLCLLYTLRTTILFNCHLSWLFRLSPSTLYWLLLCLLIWCIPPIISCSYVVISTITYTPCSISTCRHTPTTTSITTLIIFFVKLTLLTRLSTISWRMAFFTYLIYIINIV